MTEINKVFTHILVLLRFQHAIEDVLDKCASCCSAHNLKTLENLFGIGDILFVRGKIVVDNLIPLEVNLEKVPMYVTSNRNQQNRPVFDNTLLPLR